MLPMRIFAAFIAVILLSAATVSAQEFYQQTPNPNIPDTIEPGQVNVYQDSRVDSIVADYIRYNHQHEGLEGYRIQIFFDAGNNSLRRATTAAEDFKLLYPTDSAYISFSEPYYKVRIGDFRTRLQAEGYLQQILPDYPNAFVIKDRINFPPLD